MSLWNAFLLGALQGLTEFLPVSSSGHLVLLESWLHLPLESLKSFDIAVHFGTLLAIMVYFWKDILGLIKAFFLTIGQLFLRHRKPFSDSMNESRQLLGNIILATIPAIIIGLTLGDWLDEMFRNPKSVAIFMMSVGALFFVVEYIFSKLQTKKIGLVEAVLMGFAQCLALIPGVSRSGITISAGLVQGVKRDDAARFSFLLGAAAIFGATIFGLVAVMKGKYSLPEPAALFTGIATSFVFGLAAISFFMQFVKKNTLRIFGAYRIILGLIILFSLTR